MSKKETFVQNLTALCNFRNQSLSEFSKELDIPISTLKYVMSEGNTTLDTAIHISEALNLPLDSLLSDTSITEKLGIVHWTLQTVEWYGQLSEAKQRETISLVEQIIQIVLQK